MKKLLVQVVTLIVAFGIGYAVCWHFDRVHDVRTETVVKTVTVVEKAAAQAGDQQIVGHLQRALKDTEARATNFEKQLKEYADAHPANPSCRLPDSLRDQLNGELAADRPAA